jgi:hypothetical protein
MARHRGRKETRVRHRTMRAARHRTEKTAPHSILGTLIGGSAAILPFISPDPRYSVDESAVQFLTYGLDAASKGDGQAAGFNFQAAGQSIVDGVVNNFVPILGLAVLGAGVSWAGRRFAKSSTNVTRKWRVF